MPPLLDVVALVLAVVSLWRPGGRVLAVLAIVVAAASIAALLVIVFG